MAKNQQDKPQQVLMKASRIAKHVYADAEEDDKKMTTFLSIAKNLKLIFNPAPKIYRDANGAEVAYESDFPAEIVFVNRMFSTNNKEIIKELQAHGSFGELFFKDGYPKEVAEKMKEDSKYLTRERGAYEPQREY